MLCCGKRVSWFLVYARILGAASAAAIAASLVAGYRDALPKMKREHVVLVSIAQQVLHYYENGGLSKSYPVSTSVFGIGNVSGSGKTPLGVHQIKKKFGAGAAAGTIFKARSNTGKLAKIYTDPVNVETDHVTSRVMWLSGLEPGMNQGKGVDSFARYIYIHGTHEEGLIGQPASHGCVRMLNADVIELFNRLPIGTLVIIER